MNDMVHIEVGCHTCIHDCKGDMACMSVNSEGKSFVRWEFKEPMSPGEFRSQMIRHLSDVHFEGRNRAKALSESFETMCQILERFGYKDGACLARKLVTYPSTNASSHDMI